MRRYGLVAPMPSELAPLVKILRLTKDPDSHRHRGRVGTVEVVAIRSGMGLDRAATAARRLVDDVSPDHIVVVGVAGGLGPTTVGGLVRPEVVEDRASGESFVASPIAEAAGMISSSDDFALSPAIVDRLIAAGVLAVDMETAAVARVADERGLPWSAVRVISDLVTDHPDDAVLGLAHPDGRPDLAAAARFVLRNPRRVPQLVRLGRDARRAATAAAVETARQLWLVSRDPAH